MYAIAHSYTQALSHVCKDCLREAGECLFELLACSLAGWPAFLAAQLRAWVKACMRDFTTAGLPACLLARAPVCPDACMLESLYVMLAMYSTIFRH